MILDLVGTILGLALFAYAVFSVFSYFLDLATKFRMSINKNLNISLALSIIFAITWGSIWGVSPDRTIIQYVPGILIMYFYDRRRRLTKKCPECHERIKLSATKCKHCQTELYKKDNEVSI